MIELQYVSLKELNYNNTVEKFVEQFISSRTKKIDVFIIDDRTETVSTWWWRPDSQGDHLTLIGTNNSGTSTSDTWRPIKSGTVTINATSPLEFLPGDNISLDFTVDGKLTINSSYKDTTYDIVNFENAGLAPKANQHSFLSTDSNAIGWRSITKISGGKANGNNWGEIIN